jgi:hypothetical protein
MANLSQFDMSQVEPASSFDSIPAGKYVATIIESQIKPTRAQNGEYLELTFELLDGQHKGHQLPARWLIY